VGSGKRLLTVGPTGRVLVAESHGIPVTLIRRHDAVTPLFVQHHVATGDFRLALELAAAQVSDVRVTNWIDEATLRRSPMRVHDADQQERKRTITIVPDGAFTLVQGGRQQLCLLETDMGTIAPKRLQMKIRGYLLRQTDRVIPIFFVTPTASRSERVHEVVKTEARKIGVSPSFRASGSFSVRASVSPNPVSYGSYPTFNAFSSPGAVCTASVVYSTGRAPVSFNGSAQTVGSSGSVGWSWHMESKGSSGTGTVTCTLRGQSKSATANFIIA
jgi:Replication-relaxation